jgi:acyl-CoA synthetase (AMP-forming)/AMP-acid ligase II
MLIHNFLENNAKNRPDKDALVYINERICYKDLNNMADCLAAHLYRAGVKKGDRVAIIMDSSINYVISYFAVLKAGGAVVALNTATTAPAAKGIMFNCNPSAVIVQMKHKHLVEGFIDELQSIQSIIVDNKGCGKKLETKIRQDVFGDIIANNDGQKPNINIGPDDLAMIIYTSGTTGNPKGVMLAHKCLAANTDSIVRYLELTEDDKAMAILPLTYAYGNSVLLTHMCVGGTVVIDNRFAFPSLILKIMDKERVTGFAGVPSTFAILMHKSNILKYEWKSLRYFTQAGGPMAPALTSKIIESLPEVRLFVMYGQTEASARLSYIEPAKHPTKVGSVGKAIPGVTLTIRDNKGSACPPNKVGEIVATGDNVMVGYWGNPEETGKVLKLDGLHTNDMGKVDDDGFLYIVGRRSDIIKTGAHRVNPQEIEDIIAEYPGVYEAVAIGIPDDILGERIKAIVVLKEGAAVTDKEILKHCGQNLPLFKMPAVIEFRESIPKAPSGKVRRFLLARETAH